MTVALRRAGATDSDLVFQWVNLADSLAGKLQTQRPIAREEHERWFAARLADPDTFLWIIEAKSKPVGQLRLINRGGVYEIDIYVEADARRTGVAHTALRLGMAELAKLREGQTTFRALVKRSNVASQRFFEREGFARFDQHAGYMVYDLTVP
jgi:UDP-2,4-diacetamido-2,4,6-trideoxy-beta-L-altropyranose hydrolase